MSCTSGKVFLGILQGYYDRIKPKNGKRRTESAEASDVWRDAVAAIGKLSVSGLIEDNTEVKQMQYKGIKVKYIESERRWRARFQIDYSKYCVHGKTQQACYDKLKQLYDAVLKGMSKEKADLRPKVLTLGEWLEKWFAIIKTRNKASTFKRKYNCYKRYLLGLPILKKALASITLFDIQDILTSEAVTTSASRYVLYMTLHSSFEEAYIAQLIKANPCTPLRMPKPMTNERRALTVAEEEKFVTAAKGSRHWPLYALMIYCGLRPGEARALRHCDISDSYVNVNYSIDDNGGQCTTKSGKSRRVPIFDQVKEICDFLRSPSTERIFPESNKHTGQGEFNKIMKTLGLGYQLYSLRHTFATRCQEADIPPKQVQQWLGHYDTSITLKYYTHINDDYACLNVERKNSGPTFGPKS